MCLSDCGTVLNSLHVILHMHQHSSTDDQKTQTREAKSCSLSVKGSEEQK